MQIYGIYIYCSVEQYFQKTCKNRAVYPVNLHKYFLKNFVHFFRYQHHTSSVNFPLHSTHFSVECERQMFCQIRIATPPPAADPHRK